MIFGDCDSVSLHLELFVVAFIARILLSTFWLNKNARSRLEEDFKQDADAP